MKGATVRASSGDHDDACISFHAASCPRAPRVSPHVLANVSTLCLSQASGSRRVSTVHVQLSL